MLWLTFIKLQPSLLHHLNLPSLYHFSSQPDPWVPFVLCQKKKSLGKAGVCGHVNFRVIMARIQQAFLSCCSMVRKQCWDFPSLSSCSVSPWGNVSKQRFCRLKIYDQVFKIAITNRSTAIGFVHLIHWEKKRKKRMYSCNSSPAAYSHTNAIL